ncbi:HET domain protein [Metarhizium rileyi]|uniref:HET domain protein n=1 Tax=Metarhizium rileyi (strain RCEF 4871) TaxID=1649241 RepID=A0A162J9Y1_METRR|nr:HET domain protein [Metarhizium rileyi RCEF 4871]
MRLLNTKTYDLYEQCDLPNGGNTFPPYAALSHIWLPKTDNRVAEVTYKDMRHSLQRLRIGKLKQSGWEKLKKYCDFAAANCFEWAWMDTCCIDKDDAAETSESINSMFRLYKDAEICYAYLADVHCSSFDSGNISKQLMTSKWFTRGWTLQELLAPKKVVFLNKSWTLVGTRTSLQGKIEALTGIETEVLNSFEPENLEAASLATRLSWASQRRTTKPEDETYCLLGIFAVHMPLSYGEGRAGAFLRFQERLLAKYDDDSIFAWQHLTTSQTAIPLTTSDSKQTLWDTNTCVSMLAPSVSYFKESCGIRYAPSYASGQHSRKTSPFFMANGMLRFQRSSFVCVDGGVDILQLRCFVKDHPGLGIPISTQQNARFAGPMFIRLETEQNTITWGPYAKQNANLSHYDTIRSTSRAKVVRWALHCSTFQLDPYRQKQKLEQSLGLMWKNSGQISIKATMEGDEEHGPTARSWVAEDEAYITSKGTLTLQVNLIDLCREQPQLTLELLLTQDGIKEGHRRPTCEDENKSAMGVADTILETTKHHVAFSGKPFNVQLWLHPCPVELLQEFRPTEAYRLEIITQNMADMTITSLSPTT